MFRSSWRWLPLRHRRMPSPARFYVTMVLQAFAAKWNAPAPTSPIRICWQKAQECTCRTEPRSRCEKAIAYMHTGGKNGRAPGRRPDVGGRDRGRGRRTWTRNVSA